MDPEEERAARDERRRAALAAMEERDRAAAAGYGEGTSSGSTIGTGPSGGGGGNPRHDLATNPGVNDPFANDDWGNAQRSMAGIPILGWATGADAAIERANAEAEARRNRSVWENLHDAAPTRDDLTARYEDEGFVDGGPSAFETESPEYTRGRGAMSSALDSMEEWSRGGLTNTDRAMMNDTRRTEDMAARADREAALSAMEARGMGGSGSELAASLSAGEGASTRAASRNTGMLAAAQQRQYEATRAAADIGGAMRGADSSRNAALDSWNAREADYARGLEDRNTNRGNATRDNAAEAAQTEYTNRERAAAGYTNQYATDASGAANRAGREDDRNKGLLQGLGEIIGL